MIECVSDENTIIMACTTASLLWYFGQIEFQIAHLLDHLEKLLAIKCFRHNWSSSLKLSEGVFTINEHKIWNKKVVNRNTRDQKYYRKISLL